MNFRVHEEARREAIGAGVYFESLHAGLGDEFTADLLHAFEKIQESPRLFATLESTKLAGEIRRVILKRFSYLVIYEILIDRIEVLAVTHGSREPDYWGSRR